MVMSVTGNWCRRLTLIAVVLAGAAAAAQSPAPAAGGKPLFADDSVLELSLSLDFEALCRPNREPDCDYVPTELGYVSPHGELRAIPVQVLVRGGWRARRDHCEVPPLFVKFTAETVEDTPFAGQSMLPLTTHCRDRRGSFGGANPREYEQYVLREYLGYRLYQLFSDQGLRTRLVRISYSSPGNAALETQRYAFFTEHFDDLAARNGARRLPRGSFSPELVDLAALDRVSLFSFMIGNTDLSVPRERNIILLEGEYGLQYPVPYDLDMSGLVDAEYSGVSPRLDFRNPRQRYYLGFCHPLPDFPALFAEFQGQREAALQLVGEIPGLNRASRKGSRAYLDDFFDLLESPEARRADIIEACHPWPPAPIDHTTPPETAQ
jgi:hypothetical protein